MGRAGRGGGGGGRSSGGHSSSSRSFSSHRSGSASSGNRARGGGSRPDYGWSGSHNYYGGWGGHGYNGGWTPRKTVIIHTGSRQSAPAGGTDDFGRGLRIVAAVVLIVTLLMVLSAVSSWSAVPDSSYNREKLESGIPYQSDCIVDELDWFDNASKTGRQLQNFYDQTGIQPFIVLKAYDATLISDGDKEQYALDWYDTHIDNEATLLFMYFAEQDSDYDVGYMMLVNGKLVSSVMDSEAFEIFWAYTDKYWYSDLDTDEMFVEIFDNTARRIMQKTTTGADVGKTFLIVAGILAVCGLGIYFYKLKKKKDAQEAKQVEEILKTPLSTLEEDETLKKYE